MNNSRYRHHITRLARECASCRRGAVLCTQGPPLQELLHEREVGKGRRDNHVDVDTGGRLLGSKAERCRVGGCLIGGHERCTDKVGTEVDEDGEDEGG